MLRRIAPLLALALLAALGANAGAQRPFNVPNYYLTQLPRLELGVPVQGELDASDGQNYKDGSYLDLYVFDAVANEPVTIDLKSADFDTYLSVFAPDGQIVDWNDDLDYGDGSSSHLTLTPYVSGRHVVVVSGYGQYDTGSYELVLSGGMSFDASALPRIGVPGHAEGDLGVGDPAVPYGWTGPSAAYLLSVSEPTAVRISAASSDFDTYLYLYDTDENWLADNDDADYSEASGYATDSAIFRLLQPGDYVVYVAAWYYDEAGAYTLDVEVYVPQR